MMKKLEMNQMENLEGGWSWGACGAGAGGALVIAGWQAAAVGGWIGVGICAGLGCVQANL